MIMCEFVKLIFKLAFKAMGFMMVSLFMCNIICSNLTLPQLPSVFPHPPLTCFPSSLDIVFQFLLVHQVIYIPVCSLCPIPSHLRIFPFSHVVPSLDPLCLHTYKHKVPFKIYLYVFLSWPPFCREAELVCFLFRNTAALVSFPHAQFKRER